MVLSSKELSGNVVPLLKEAAFLAGDWVSDTEATIAVSNPADASNVGCVPRLTPAHVNHAIKAAVKSWPAWKAKRADERAEILHCWDALIRDNRESLATLMTLEQGKPIAESRAEIDYARSFIGWFAEEAQRQYGDVIPSHLPGGRLFVLREPIGVVAGSYTMEFPVRNGHSKSGCRNGCRVPGNRRSIQSHTIFRNRARKTRRYGRVPSGVLSVLTGNNSEIVPELCRSNDVRALSFTGSTEVGRLLMRESADTIKKVSLELGGHAPFIVFEDADIDKAVEGCIAAKFTTSGQDCLAANRIYVHREIYDTFASRFTVATAGAQGWRGIGRRNRYWSAHKH